jgi:hypothetical protein
MALNSRIDIVRAGHQNATEIGLLSANGESITPEQALLVRNVLDQTLDDDFLNTLQGFTGVVDSGATSFSTSEETDFKPGTFVKCETKQVMKGIAGGLEISGKGQVEYEVIDHHGVVQYIEGPGLLIKKLPCRLIPPQRIMTDDSEGYYRINGEGGKFVFANNSGQVKTPFHPSSNLPMITLFEDIRRTSELLETSLHSCITKENNQNLSPSAKETLRWHFRLGHASVTVIQWLARQGLLGRLSTKMAKQNESPKCGTCQYGKQTRKPVGTMRGEPRPEKIGGVIKDKLIPGQEVACDQFEVRKRGRKFATRGKEKETENSLVVRSSWMWRLDSPDVTFRCLWERKKRSRQRMNSNEKP